MGFILVCCTEWSVKKLRAYAAKHHYTDADDPSRAQISVYGKERHKQRRVQDGK